MEVMSDGERYAIREVFDDHIKYLDLKTCNHWWTVDDAYFMDAIGSREEVINAWKAWTARKFLREFTHFKQVELEELKNG